MLLIERMVLHLYLATVVILEVHLLRAFRSANWALLYWLYRGLLNNARCSYMRLEDGLRKVPRRVVVCLRVLRVSRSAVVTRVLTFYWHGILLCENHG